MEVNARPHSVEECRKNAAALEALALQHYETDAELCLSYGTAARAWLNAADELRAGKLNKNACTKALRHTVTAAGGALATAERRLGVLVQKAKARREGWSDFGTTYADCGRYEEKLDVLKQHRQNIAETESGTAAGWLALGKQVNALIATSYGG